MTMSDDGYTLYVPNGDTGLILVDVTRRNAPNVTHTIATADSK